MTKYCNPIDLPGTARADGRRHQAERVPPVPCVLPFKRLLVCAALGSVLVACGGGSGGDTPLGEQDFDNDDIINSEDLDADGDGIADIADPFVDLDRNGLDDTTGALPPLAEQDFDNDTIANSEDLDADGDGIDDITDPFVDLDSDGLDDRTGAVEFPVSAQNPCGMENGTDNDSSTPDWGDNCVVKRSSIGGQFADSLYAVGIQRVVYCVADYGNENVDGYTGFADGEYGPNSESVTQEFQRAQGLVDDGIVGPQTWGALQDQLTRLSGELFAGLNAYGFTEGRCANIPLFYQSVTRDGQGFVLGGWLLAQNEPNTTQTIPFSVAEPFGILTD